MGSQKTPTKAGKPSEDQAKAKPFKITREGLAKATGSSSEAFQAALLTRVSETLWLPASKDQEAQDRAIETVYDALRSIAPRSELEGMLAAQMLAAHNAAMDCMRRAMVEGQTFEAREQNLKHAAKLMSLYERQLAALDKHRGKGQQRITVEHVTVEAGGQAIVGEVHTGGKEQKPRGREQGALSDDSAAEALSREALKEARPAKARSRKVEK